MNMLIRYLILCLLLKDNTTSKNRPNFQQAIRHSYLLLPHDMGFRNHLPNYRYLSFIELNIQQWLLQQRLNEQPNQQKLQWIIVSQQMTYIKQAKLFDKITLNSQLLGWDSKYFYFRHEFVIKDKIVAVGLTKFVLMLADTIKPTAVIVDTPEQSHPVIRSWQANLQDIKQLDTI